MSDNIIEIILQDSNLIKVKEELKNIFGDNIISITTNNDFKDYIKYIIILQNDIENKDILFLKEKYKNNHIEIYKISCNNINNFSDIPLLLLLLFLLLILLYLFNIFYSKNIDRCNKLGFNSFNIFTSECKYYNTVNGLLEMKKRNKIMFKKSKGNIILLTFFIFYLTFVFKNIKYICLIFIL